MEQISREELKRRMMQCGGISPDDAENAAVIQLFEDFEELGKDRDGWRSTHDRCFEKGKAIQAEIDRLRAGQQTPPQGKTVEVRVAVAVDREGHWSAAGWQGASADQARDAASEMVAEGESIYWLTATLPVPAEVTVMAKVSTATNNETATSGGKG